MFDWHIREHVKILSFSKIRKKEEKIITVEKKSKHMYFFAKIFEGHEHLTFCNKDRETILKFSNSFFARNSRAVAIM